MSTPATPSKDAARCNLRRVHVVDCTVHQRLLTLIADNATLPALNPGLWFRRVRLDMLPPVARHHSRNQAGVPLIGLFKFAQPPKHV